MCEAAITQNTGEMIARVLLFSVILLDPLTAGKEWESS